MQLRGITFKPCWDASGLRGWGGEGYWFHHAPVVRRMYDFSGSTRVAKTTTMYQHRGNMPLKGPAEKYAPKESFPRCVWWSLAGSRTLNAVGLSGPGAHLLGNDLFWASDKEPYMISFMSVRPAFEERLEELAQFCTLLDGQLRGTEQAQRIALQINLSCPNTGLDTGHLMHEAARMLDIAARAPVPKVVKVNILPPTEAVAEIARHKECDALCFSNTLPFGSLPDKIDWKRLFPGGSPLLKRDGSFGAGGYSGPELLPLVCEYGRKLREAGVEKPFNLGGGIRSPRDVDYAVAHGGLRRGKDSVFFASAAMVRPWNIRGIIRRAHELLG
jgi:dihydroorotate dehydrogenase